MESSNKLFHVSLTNPREVAAGWSKNTIMNKLNMNPRWVKNIFIALLFVSVEEECKIIN